MEPENTGVDVAFSDIPRPLGDNIEDEVGTMDFESPEIAKIPGVEEDKILGVDKEIPETKGTDNTSNHLQTEYEWFQAAIEEGRGAAKDGWALTTCTRNQNHEEIYEYIHATLGAIDPEIVLNLLSAEPQEEARMSFLTAQMSAKAGIKHFRQPRADTIMKELKQLL